MATSLAACGAVAAQDAGCCAQPPVCGPLAKSWMNHTVPLPLQLVWWSTLSEKYTAEMQAQPGVFGGEYGERAHTDFRCVCLLSCSRLQVTKLPNECSAVTSGAAVARRHL